MAGTTAGAELTTRTVVVEIKYFCTKNVVIHTENCKLNLPLDCSTTQMEKNIRRMCGIDESSRRRGLADFALEVFYIDFIEAGCSRKAPFVIRTKDQWEMLQTKDTRLSEDGKRIECMRCGKSPKLDKCKRTAECHIKYFQRVHNCNPTKTSEQTNKISEYFEPTEKRPKMVASDEGADQSSLFESSESLL